MMRFGPHSTFAASANRQFAKEILERLGFEGEVVRQAMLGDLRSIKTLSSLLLKKIRSDHEEYKVERLTSEEKVKLEKTRPKSRGAIGLAVLHFTAASMMVACHNKQQLMPTILVRLLVETLGAHRYNAKNAESFGMRRTLRRFVVAFPNATTRTARKYLAVVYEATPPSHNTIEAWCLDDEIEHTLWLIHNKYHQAEADEIVQECRDAGSDIRLPKRNDPLKSSGILKILEDEFFKTTGKVFS